ncbi:peptide ABC transporter ATP-binding protein [Haloprofundus marisrubri]|uniref:Peptide ABC transporter ATP-binding protein n=1 Tax=Haloprofundus marisrubri TaxID=1514971 RepID=A0A0W1R5V7_9EURY|nr:peptide ABC transporter ATP-binding protein [Haloprofundus marisrubri]
MLTVRGLEKHYPITEGLLRREVGRVRAVDGVDFELRRGETLGLIGESGCGKSTAARSLLHLDEPTGGTVAFDGDEVGEFDRQRRRRFRRRAQLVLQNPTSSFDPRLTIGESVAEPLEIHGMTDASTRRAVVEDTLERTGLQASMADRYPHELSGGQKQRAALARALVLDPDLVVADEPVSALDVSVQAEIIALLRRLVSTFELSLLVISHDMGVVRELCDRVAVMYAGEIVERGPVESVFERPQHPYTRALVAAVPTPDPRAEPRPFDLHGDVPDPAEFPDGCRFHPRCPAVIQPPDADLQQREWQRIVAFRAAVDAGQVDPEALVSAVEVDVSVDTDTSGGIDASADADAASDASSPSPPPSATTAIRAAYDLPTLDDDERSSALSTAVDAVSSGDADHASEILEDAFPTVCIRENPSLRPTDLGHAAACHLHGEVRETETEAKNGAGESGVTSSDEA